MGKMILKDAFFSINGVDLSDHIRQIDVSYKAEIIDKSCMKDRSKAKVSGLTDWNATLRFAQNYDAGKVDATLFPMVGGGEQAVIMRPTQAAKGADNPEYTGNVLVADYPPISGGHGALAEASVTLEGSGDLDRAV